MLRGGAAPAAPAIPKNAIDLISLIDPRLDSVTGDFIRDASGLTTPNAVTWARVMVPYTPPAEYDLTLVVERKAGINSFNFGALWNGRLCHIAVDGKGPGIDDASGIDFINGRPFYDNETTARGPFLSQGKPSTIVVSVRKTSLSMSIDGKNIFTWNGDPSRIAPHGGWRVPNSAAMVVGSYDSQFLVSRMLLTPLSGQGKKLR